MSRRNTTFLPKVGKTGVGETGVGEQVPIRHDHERVDFLMTSLSNSGKMRRMVCLWLAGHIIMLTY